MKASTTLGRIVLDAMKEWRDMKAQGIALADRVKGLEAVLREVWPFAREWKYLCAQCDDLGVKIAECPGDATCGRSKEHLPHTFGTPCWCALGQRFKDKPRSEDDFTAAGRTPARKSRPMSRFQ